MTAVNEVKEFRYRIIDNIPVCFDRIHVGTTIGREDGTFGFGFFKYTPDRQLFLQNAQKEIERVQALTGLCKDRESDRQDLVRFSPVPWIAFTEMKHASSFRTGDSATRISTGKLIEQNGHRMLPISVTAHHGLMDGRHVSILLDRIADKDG
jgi:chloramphenicol O-acetyltransferase type A